MLSSFLVIGFGLFVGAVLPPACMWWHDFIICKDVTRCDKCPIHTLHNTEKYCKGVGKACKDVHYCCTRKWL